MQIAAVEAKEATGQRAVRSMSEEAIRKRREREEKRAAAARAKALAEGAEPVGTVESEEVSAAPLETPPETGRPATPMGSLSNSQVAWTVTVPTSSASELPWYATPGATYSTLEDASAAGIWSYPSSPVEKAKCGVFRDLWEKGYCMGGGIKFGGDFLVYPGTYLPIRSIVLLTDEQPTRGSATLSFALRCHCH